MDKFKSVAKGGWHPSEQGMGKKTSLRGDFKGVNTVAGWVGKGKDTSGYKAEDHQSAPLSSLKDPDSFGPPPVRRGTHDPYAANPSSPASRTTHAGGLGTPISTGQIHGQESRLERERREAAEAEEEAERKAAVPPLPYRSDTTGLSTAGLPPPPKRGDAGSLATHAAAKPKPSLPPRLPPRGAAEEPPPPPTYTEAVEANPAEGVLNQGALHRLGQAGVSVPGLGIGANGSSNPPPLPPSHNNYQNSSPQTPESPLGHGGQMNELQQRFARMNRGGDTAATTLASGPTSPVAHAPGSPIGKKAPPPPPPKKRELHAAASETAPVPPPLPMQSKPSWQ